jgi:hypothetical protein
MARTNIIQRLINRPTVVTRARVRGAPVPADDQGGRSSGSQGATPVFITKESIISFGGATAASYGVWIVLSLLFGAKPSGVLWLGFVIALLVSLFLWWQAIADPRVNTPTPLSSFEKKQGFGLAILNSFQIFLAALGSIKASGL